MSETNDEYHSCESEPAEVQKSVDRTQGQGVGSGATAAQDSDAPCFHEVRKGSSGPAQTAQSIENWVRYLGGGHCGNNKKVKTDVLKAFIINAIVPNIAFLFAFRRLLDETKEKSPPKAWAVVSMAKTEAALWTNEPLGKIVWHDMEKEGLWTLAVLRIRFVLVHAPRFTRDLGLSDSAEESEFMPALPVGLSEEQEFRIAWNMITFLQYQQTGGRMLGKQKGTEKSSPGREKLDQDIDRFEGLIGGVQTLKKHALRIARTAPLSGTSLAASQAPVRGLGDDVRVQEKSDGLTDNLEGHKKYGFRTDPTTGMDVTSFVGATEANTIQTERFFEMLAVLGSMDVSIEHKPDNSVVINAHGRAVSLPTWMEEYCRLVQLQAGLQEGERRMETDGLDGDVVASGPSIAGRGETEQTASNMQTEARAVTLYQTIVSEENNASEETGEPNGPPAFQSVHGQSPSEEGMQTSQMPTPPPPRISRMTEGGDVNSDPSLDTTRAGRRYGLLVGLNRGTSSEQDLLGPDRVTAGESSRAGPSQKKPDERAPKTTAKDNRQGMAPSDGRVEGTLRRSNRIAAKARSRAGNVQADELRMPSRPVMVVDLCESSDEESEEGPGNARADELRMASRPAMVVDLCESSDDESEEDNIVVQDRLGPNKSQADLRARQSCPLVDYSDDEW